MAKQNVLERMRQLQLLLFLIVIVILLFGGCANAGTQDGRTALKAAVWKGGDNGDFIRQAEAFNEKNSEYYVEIVEYESPESSGDPYERLTKDILAGKGPDIISLGSGDNPMALAAGKLTEDLFPLMKADEAFSLEDYYENILEAFSLGESLYTLPVSFSVDTFAGQEEKLGPYITLEQGANGSCYTWTVDQLIECCDALGVNGEDVYLFSGMEPKRGIFGHICYTSLDNYVDWEKNECRFEEDGFVNLLKFVDSFPGEFTWRDDYSFRGFFREGKILLYSAYISDIWEMAVAEQLYSGGRIVFPGYPVACGQQELGGAIARSRGELLGISSTSRCKEGAWEFIKSFLAPEYQRQVEGIPLLKEASEERIQNALIPQYENVDGEQILKVRYEKAIQEEESIRLTEVSQAQAQAFRELIESVHRCQEMDQALYDIVLEEADIFFSGDRTAEETASIIQDRASVYIGERIR